MSVVVRHIWVFLALRGLFQVLLGLLSVAYLLHIPHGDGVFISTVRLLPSYSM